MAEIDEFASSLLEESKRFLEKAAEADSQESEAGHLHAALMLAFCALEAHTNAIADEFSARPELTVHERAVLLEQEVRLDKGEFKTGGLKIYRLEERILFLHQRFSSRPLDRTETWWGDLSVAIDLRNQLTHPKGKPGVKLDDVKRAIQAIVTGLDVLYRAIYQRPFPAANRGLQSRLTF